MVKNLVHVLDDLNYNPKRILCKCVRPQNDENFASRSLCGKQASYRPVSTTVGDHVGIPVAELFFFFHAPILSFLRLFLDFSVRLERSKCSKDVLIASNTPWSPRAVRWNQNRKKCAK